MALTREERAQIRQAVLRCRQILTEEFDQLLRLYGILPDRIVSVPPDRQEVQEKLKQALSRESNDHQKARERYIKCSVFTFLNRILALRIAEANHLIIETVITRPQYGDRSRRERDLADADPDLAVQPEKLAQEALRIAFLEMQRMMNEQLLFNENSPYGILMPRLPAYRQIREILRELPENVWREFELLGWAYQFFNSEEREIIRRRLRRNPEPEPDDIPPKNQFYTVGWIVKALVQNTLGKLWLEIHPNSSLREKLDYLVPVQNNFSLPNRSISVQEIKILDPACGSGHFLLGAFDLLVEMWLEERKDIPPWKIPALILEHNLYGVDIDLRACQLSALALWLKARTTFELLKGNDVEAKFEPKRINIVCADIHFIDGNRKSQFLKQFSYDPHLYRIVAQVLDSCENAFEIGSLLQIRQPFEQLLNQRKKHLNNQKLPQPSFPSFPMPLTSNLKEKTVAEIIERITEFIREATEAQDMGSLLFCLDAENAVHLVDVLTDYYDVILMNPPYGAMPPRCKQYVRTNYRAYRDYYTAFIEQAINLCKEGGYIGALTGRTFLFLKSHQRLREEILRSEALPEIVWDLGFNVLDEAVARYAAFTLRKRYEGDGIDWREHSVTFFKLTDWDWEEKRIKFEEALSKIKQKTL
jgi:predicted RNA methylase